MISLKTMQDTIYRTFKIGPNDDSWEIYKISRHEVDTSIAEIYSAIEEQIREVVVKNATMEAKVKVYEAIISGNFPHNNGKTWKGGEDGQ